VQWSAHVFLAAGHEVHHQHALENRRSRMGLQAATRDTWLWRQLPPHTEAHGLCELRQKIGRVTAQQGLQ